MTNTLTELFGSHVQLLQSGSWQVDTPDFRLLILLSEDQSWLRALLPIAAAQETQPLVAELLEANFDLTQETRYALYQEVVWGVFQHSLETLSPIDFSAALARLVSLHQKGLSDCFNLFVEKRIRQIIQSAKLQNQSLETTLRTLERLYQEGVMGELDQGKQSREETLAAWRRQLERLWPEVEPE